MHGRAESIGCLASLVRRVSRPCELRFLSVVFACLVAVSPLAAQETGDSAERVMATIERLSAAADSASRTGTDEGYRRAIAIFHSVLALAPMKAAATGSPSEWLESATHVRIGRMYWRLGDTAAAFDHLETGEELARRVGHEFNQVGSLKTQGHFHASLGDTTAAIRAYQRAVEICEHDIEPSANQCSPARDSLRRLRSRTDGTPEDP